MPEKYETYGGNFILPHPYVIEQMSGYGVAVAGDIFKMQELCNRTLNCNGKHLHYFVIAPTVLFTFMRMGSLRSGDAPDSEHGFFTEQELNVTMLLAAIDTSGIRLVWYMPYLWLDSGAALIAGRDIYGFPKQLATVTMPAGPGDLAEMSATGEVLHRFEPVQARDMNIVSVRRTDTAQLEILTSVADIVDALGGKHITDDIAQGLSTTVAHAERMKTLWGSAIPSGTDDRESISVPLLGERGTGTVHTVPKSILTGIIRPRLEEIYDLVRQRIEASPLARLGAGRAVLTGGGSELNGAREMASQWLGMTARSGVPLPMQNMPDAGRTPGFAVAAGLLLYALNPDRHYAIPAAAAMADSPEPKGYFRRVGRWLVESL